MDDILEIGPYIPDKTDFVFKEAQKVENLTVPGKDDEECKLVSTYGSVKFIDAGKFGLVFKMSRLHEYMEDKLIVLEAVDFALKLNFFINPNDVNDNAYKELLINYYLMKTLENDGFNLRPANIVKMFDWTKCSLELRDFFAGNIDPGFKLPIEDYRAVKDDLREKGIGVGEESEYQFMVMEYAKGNTLYNYIDNNRKLFYGNWAVFGSIFVQIFATLKQLGTLYGFTHYDLYPANVLWTPSEEHSKDHYYVYHLMRISLAIPIRLEGIEIPMFKIADMGKSAMETFERGETIPDLTRKDHPSLHSHFETEDTKIKSKKTSAHGWNPLYDYYRWGLTILEDLMWAIVDKTVDFEEIEPKLFTLFLQLIPGKWNYPGIERIIKGIRSRILQLRDISDKPDAARYAVQTRGHARAILDALSKSLGKGSRGLDFEIPALSQIFEATNVNGLFESELFQLFEYSEVRHKEHTDMTLVAYANRHSATGLTKLENRFKSRSNSERGMGIGLTQRGKYVIVDLKTTRPVCNHTYADKKELVEHVTKKAADQNLCLKCNRTNFF